MLTFSESVWRNFLNPTSNLNRFRLNNYRDVFDTYFQKVEIKVLERLESEFRAVHSRIRPEFLTGDETVDSVGLIQVIAEVKK
jgi:hypothetical protein